MGWLKPYLTPTQLERLKEHQYCSEGSSLFEVFMQPYWRWLVTKVPLWVAPNTITMAGFIINLLTTLPVLLLDLNVEGKLISQIMSGQGQPSCPFPMKSIADNAAYVGVSASPRWTYLGCAAGFFIYQSCDAIDGKQARRTGSNSPLGELFDHGCDALSTFFVAITGVCALGMQDYPYTLLGFILLVLELAFFYHWQTYVCGVLHFKRIDVTEAQFAHISILTVAGLFGTEVWKNKFPYLDVYLDVIVAVCIIVLSVYNLFVAFSIILTSGVGKNGSTVADTSVLSPVVSVLVQVPVVVYYAQDSPGQLLQSHCVLFLTAFTLPIVKSIIHMVVAGMTKSPYPLLDSIMLGPLLAYANIYFGSPISELYVAIFLACYNCLDIVRMCISLCQQICEFLNISCFSITSLPSLDHTHMQ